MPPRLHVPTRWSAYAGGVAERYPPIEPFDKGMLDVGDGNSIYWELSGNPDGKPALALHGGPGGGSSPGRRRSFDPDVYLLVQFDQRGCGRSTPSAADPDTDLSSNTTTQLIGDIERLREYLGIDSWLVWGGSWGVTLGLAYAQRHPDRVTEMVLVSITLTRARDVQWLYHQAGRFFPREWARFRAGAGIGPAPSGDVAEVDLVARYHHLLNVDPDPSVKARAARDWCEWEDAVVSLEQGWTPDPRYLDPGYRMAFARLCAQYFSHAAWLADDELLLGAARLVGIPAVLIHGRFDIGGPPDVAWDLARAWPGAELQLVGTGHTGGGEMTELTIAALDRFGRGG
jgi:proline iminopeptidase